MILLLGGTSDSAPLAEALAQRGYQVLVSTATQTELNVGQHPAIQRRCGLLDKEAMTALIQEQAIQAIVDATHPYAAVVKVTASEIAEQLGLPYLSFIRPSSIANTEKQGIHLVPDHQTAAQLAVTYHRPILLTIGVKNLSPYAALAQATQIPLIARVLPTDSSYQACRAVGLLDPDIILARGPFSVAENQVAIRHFNIGVLVTKDGGAAGGVPEKLTAAQIENCEVIVVQRPVLPEQAVFYTIDQLLENLQQQLGL